MGKIVMKFGGTSVQDTAAIRKVRDIVKATLEQGNKLPVVVVSAMAGVTDTLVRMSEKALEGRLEGSVGVLSDLRSLQTRHLSVLRDLFGNSGRLDAKFRGQGEADFNAAEAVIYERFGELEGLVRSVATLRELTPRSQDAIISIGERLSSFLVANAFQGTINRELLDIDARTFMITDDQFTCANPRMDEAKRFIHRALVTDMQMRGVPVTQGFIGATGDIRVRGTYTTTLGRGGSDYSAAIIGAAIGAEEIQIWTDVDGMLTADPRIVFSKARLVPQLTFVEAAELAYFGAKVLHPKTIQPALEKGIPVRILNSLNPKSPGTIISSERGDTNGPTAIACKRDVTVVDITSTRMLMAHGFLAKVFEVFARFKTAIDVVTTSEISVSVTIDDASHLRQIAQELEVFAQVETLPQMAILAVVGEQLPENPRLIGEILTLLGRFPIQLVSQSAARRNLTVVLNNDDLPAVTVQLHEKFFPE